MRDVLITFVVVGAPFGVADGDVASGQLGTAE
jgi:hypothetical protein